MKKNAKNAGIDEVSFNDSAFKVRLKRNLEILSNVLANPTTVFGSDDSTFGFTTNILDSVS